MTPVALTPELNTLAWSVVLLIAQVFLQAQTMTSELGLNYNVSARDERKTTSGVYAGRAQRALANLLETYPAFVALALALTVSGRTGGWGAAGAYLWFWARVAYAPVYLLGIPYLRSILWGLSLAGLVMMLARLLS